MFIDSKCVFALCKYSTSKGLVTNVNKKNDGLMKYFFQRIHRLYMNILLQTRLGDIVIVPGCFS